jgi:hypothetical protein
MRYLPVQCKCLASSLARQSRSPFYAPRLQLIDEAIVQILSPFSISKNAWLFCLLLTFLPINDRPCSVMLQWNKGRKTPGYYAEDAPVALLPFDAAPPPLARTEFEPGALLVFMILSISKEGKT